MALDHAPCPETRSALPACTRIPHNDGTPCDPAAFRAWVDDAYATGRRATWCGGTWDFAGPLDLAHLGDGIKGPVLVGPGSYLTTVRVSTPSGGSLIDASGTASLELGGFLLTPSGQHASEYGLKLGGSVNRLVDFRLSGSRFSKAALGLIESGNNIFDTCRIYTYGGGGTATIRSEGSGGQIMTGCEIHNFAPLGSVFDLYGGGSIQIVGGVISSSAPASSTNGYAVFNCHGDTFYLSLDGTIVECEPGGHPASFFCYSDGTIYGLSARAVSVACSFAVLGLTASGNLSGVQFHGGISGGAKLMVAHPSYSVPLAPTPIQQVSFP
jgi:hypothetical protein